MRDLPSSPPTRSAEAGRPFVLRVIAARTTFVNARAPFDRPVAIATVFAARLGSVGAIAQETKLQAPAAATEAAGDEEAGDKDATREDGEESWLPGEVSGSVALTSNYVDRGITNSSNDPAIQGALDYAVPTGLGNTQGYVGFWSSSVDLEGDRDTAHIEIDPLFGVRGEIGGVGWASAAPTCIIPAPAAPTISTTGKSRWC